MKPFALITTDPLEFIRPMDAMPNKVKSGYAVVPQVKADAPTYDPATQKLQAERTVSAGAVTHGFTKISLTPEELAQRQKAAQQEAERPNIANWITTLKAGSATNAQVQRAVAWLLRDSTGL
jgi:hypothetical protein